MVFTFLKARGLDTGSSLVEDDKIELAKELETKATSKGGECCAREGVGGISA